MSVTYQRIWATFFDRLDMDRDGFLTVKDFEALATKLVERGRLDVERGRNLKAQLVEMWDTFYKDIAGGQPIPRDAFIEAAKKTWHHEVFRRTADACHHLWFASIDTNQDGVIQLEEFVHFFNIIGIAEEDAKFTFDAMDANHDGWLSLEEYVAFGMECITTEDETSPSRFFWGPLSTL